MENNERTPREGQTRHITLGAELAIEVADDRGTVRGWAVLADGNEIGSAIPPEGDSIDCWYDGDDLTVAEFEQLFDLV